MFQVDQMPEPHRDLALQLVAPNIKPCQRRELPDALLFVALGFDVLAADFLWRLRWDV